MKEYLAHLPGIDIIATAMLVVFFILFSYILFRVIRMKKTQSDAYSRIPLNND